jgi:hypothetical protein
MEILNKLRTELPYDPVVPLLGIYQRVKDTSALLADCSATHNDKIRNQPTVH